MYSVVISGHQGDYMRTKTVGVRELKAHLSALLQELQKGDLEVVVTVRGRAVARMEAVSAEPPVDGMGGMRGALADWPDLTWEDFQAAKKIWEPRPLDEA